MITGITVATELPALVQVHPELLQYGERSIEDVTDSARQLVGDYDEYKLFAVDLDERAVRANGGTIGDGTYRSYLDVTAPHFHVARGRHLGGPFLQEPAWEVRETVLESVCRRVGDEAAEK